MPAALDVDREQVRMLVAEVGVREAARRIGIPEATVQAWSARGKWLAALPRNVPLPPTVLRPATNATKTPVNALYEVMREDSLDTRATALRITKRALKRVERCDDDELMQPEVADVLNKHTKTAAVAGGWAANVVVAKVNLGATGSTDHVIDVEGRVCEEPQVIEDDPLAGF